MGLAVDIAAWGRRRRRFSSHHAHFPVLQITIAMSDENSVSSASDPLDTRDDEGWEDASADEESIEVKGLFSDEIFPSAQSMIANAKEKFGFDFLGIRNNLGVYILYVQMWFFVFWSYMFKI